MHIYPHFTMHTENMVFLVKVYDNNDQGTNIILLNYHRELWNM